MKISGGEREREKPKKKGETWTYESWKICGSRKWEWEFEDARADPSTWLSNSLSDNEREERKSMGREYA